jgi:hypothetical protein
MIRLTPEKCIGRNVGYIESTRPRDPPHSGTTPRSPIAPSVLLSHSLWRETLDDGTYANWYRLTCRVNVSTMFVDS